ncbi:MAG: YdcF family protein [Bacteroidales bacterium]
MRLSRRKNTFIKYALAIGVLFLLIFVFKNAGFYLVRSSYMLHHVSSIICMGSIPDRALAAIDLYEKGLIRHIYIVEENMLGIIDLKKKKYTIQTHSEQMKSILQQAGIADSLITIIPGYARSTLMEAQAFEKWLSLHPESRPDTLLIITSAAHTRRATMIFNHVLNRNASHNISIASYPSPYSGYNAQKWFTSKEDIQTTLSEYIKILSFQLVERWN